MEKFILSLCGLWFYLTRKYRTRHYRQAAGTLDSARQYLASDFCNRASTRDRGFLLADQAEAIALLERHGSLVTETSDRFASLADCIRFVSDELSDAPIAAKPAAARIERVKPPVTLAPAVPSQPAPVASFAAFWSSEGAGSEKSRPATFAHSTIVRAFTRGGDSLAPVSSNVPNSRVA